MPMHDVVPRAVKIAVATDAIICTMNFSVSFFVIALIDCHAVKVVKVILVKMDISISNFFK